MTNGLWVLVINLYAGFASPGTNGGIQTDSISNKGQLGISVAVAGGALGTKVVSRSAAAVAVLPVTVVVEAVQSRATGGVVDADGGWTPEAALRLDLGCGKNESNAEDGDKEQR